MRRIIAGTTLVIAICVTGTAVNAAVQSDKVVGGPGNQFWPSSDGQLVAYAEYRQKQYRAFVGPVDGSSRRMVNERNRSGTLGTLIAGTDTVVFQQWTRSSSGLYFYDVSSRTRKPVPGPVKSRQWEYWPAGSQRFILYLRWSSFKRQSSLLLYDRVAETNRVLIADTGGKTLYPGYAGDRYVAWTTCGAASCSIWYFDDTTDTMTKVPLPAGRAQYGPAIDETTGTMYFIESDAHVCGRHVSLRRTTIGGVTSDVLQVFPHGIDTGWTLALAPNPTSGNQDLFYQRYDCGRKTGDVYAFRSVDLAIPITMPGVPGGNESGAVGRPGSLPGGPPSRRG